MPRGKVHQGEGYLEDTPPEAKTCPGGRLIRGRGTSKIPPVKLKHAQGVGSSGVGVPRRYPYS